MSVYFGIAPSVVKYHDLEKLNLQQQLSVKNELRSTAGIRVLVILLVSSFVSFFAYELSGHCQCLDNFKSLKNFLFVV